MMKTNKLIYLILILITLFSCEKKENDSGDENIASQDSITFNTDLTYGSVIDFDGNVYRTIKIGTQTWMAENLKVTHYQNGDAISNETDLSKWNLFQLDSGAYCYYNNDSTYKKVYGAIYNWYAASDIRNIAPSGWHVATQSDWQTLADYLKADYQLNQYYGYKIRETNMEHWKQSVLSATNESGLTIFPGGYLDIPPVSFTNIGITACYWTSTGDLDFSYYADASYNVEVYPLINNKYRGLYVRCIKN